LYTLLQVAGAHASILGAYGAAAGTLKTSINAFRRTSTRLPGSPLAGRISNKQTDKRSTGVPEPISDEATTQPMRGDAPGERIGDFRIVGDKGLRGTTFERNITGIYNVKGRQTDVGPILRLYRGFLQEAKAAGATHLKITGDYVRNDNVMRLQRILPPGSTISTSGTTSDASGRIEITIPLQ
jgi:hypothetical protein